MASQSGGSGRTVRGGGFYLTPDQDEGDFSRLGLFRRLVRETGIALALGALIVLVFVAYQLLGTDVVEQHDQSRLHRQFDQAVAVAVAAAPTTATPSTTTPGGTTTTTAPGSAGAPPVPTATADAAIATATATATTVAGSPASPGGPTTPAPATSAPTAPGSTVPGVATTTSGAAPTTTPGAIKIPTIGGTTGGAGSLGSTPPVVDHLSVPAIGLDTYVVQGTTQKDLAQGPGHYVGTVMPGQVGNAAIAGHRTTHGAPFFRLNGVHVGDDIYVTNTAGTRYTYRVTASHVVSPDDVSVLDPTTFARLTLTTCNPRFMATQRLVVVAKLVAGGPAVGVGAQGTKTPGATTTVPGATTTAPGATTTTVPATSAATKPAALSHPAGTSSTLSAAMTTDASVQPTDAIMTLGQGDPHARTPAITDAIILGALWILTRIAIHHSRRWLRTICYLVGVGLCVLFLWFTFENVLRLLPTTL